nr:uncharacterized protein LOC106828345 [Equus asinus]
MKSSTVTPSLLNPYFAIILATLMLALIIIGVPGISNSASREMWTPWGKLTDFHGHKSIYSFQNASKCTQELPNTSYNQGQDALPCTKNQGGKAPANLSSTRQRGGSG